VAELLVSHDLDGMIRAAFANALPELAGSK
jgi:hypothetical protein